MRAPESLALRPARRSFAAALNFTAYAFTSSRHSPVSDRTRCDGMQPSGARPVNHTLRAPRWYSLCDIIILQMPVLSLKSELKQALTLFGRSICLACVP